MAEAGIVPALVFCLVVSGAHGNNNKFPCYGDRCNRGNTDQFCSSTFRYCRDCADVVESCGTADQPLNCTSFCADHLAELKLKDKRVGHNVSYDSGYLLQGTKTMTCTEDGVWVSSDNDAENTCSNLSPIRNGFWLSSSNTNKRHVPGDKVEAVCDQGYFMDGAASWNCSNDGNWTSSDLFFPICFPLGETAATNFWSTMGIVALCAFSISLLINIAMAIICCEQRKQLKERNNYDEKSGLLAIPSTDPTVSFRDEGKQEKGLACLNFPQPNISSSQCNTEMTQPKRQPSPDKVASKPETQPQTRPVDRLEEKLSCPLQPESQYQDRNEYGHDTSRKTVEEDTYHAFAPSSGQRLHLSQQQTVNNEQDLAQKIAMTSGEINADDITQRRFGSVHH